MRYLSLREVLELHRLLLERTGGLAGVRDLGLLESAVAQPLMTFGGQELYPTVAEKAAALGWAAAAIMVAAAAGMLLTWNQQ